MSAQAGEVLRVFLVDDHDLVRRGVRDLLSAARDVMVVGESSDAGPAAKQILALDVDVMVLDKITILQIKSERMTDASKVANVRTELDLLESTWRASPHAQHDIRAEWASLKAINEKLWVIEDDIRDKERDKAFDERFIELARAVYVTNDERAAVKRQINSKLGSRIVEEKSYKDYK